MKEIKQLLNQTVIYGLSSVLARVLNFLLVPLYTILFIPSEYAIVTEMYAYAAFLIVLGCFGMETTFFRFSELNKKLKPLSTAFSFLCFNSILLLLIGSFFYQDIAKIIRHTNNPEYVLFFIVIIALDLLAIIPFAFLRHQNKAVKFAIIKTINIVINISGNIFFLILCPYLIKKGFFTQALEIIYNPGISIGYVFLSNLIASLVTLLLLTKEIGSAFAWPDFKLFKKMLHYAWPILLGGCAFMINENIDKILLKYLLPGGIAMRELGIYSACYKLTIFMTLFVQAYRFAAEPFFFNQFHKPNAKKIYANMMQFFVLYSLYIFLAVVLYVDLIKLIIPNQLYHEGVIIIPIVLFANVCLGMYYNLSVWYKVTNRTEYAAIISGIGAIITIVLNMLLIPLYGYIGAAWTTLVCYLSMTFLSYYFGQKQFPINYNHKMIGIYFLIALSFYFLSGLTDAEIVNNIQIDNTVFFTIYSIFIYSETKKIFKSKDLSSA